MNSNFIEIPCKFFIEIPCKFLYQTEMAVLIEDADGSETWIPKSQIMDFDSTMEPGTDTELLVAEWFAEKEGLV